MKPRLTLLALLILPLFTARAQIGPDTNMVWNATTSSRVEFPNITYNVVVSQPSTATQPPVTAASGLLAETNIAGTNITVGALLPMTTPSGPYTFWVQAQNGSALSTWISLTTNYAAPPLLPASKQKFQSAP